MMLVTIEEASDHLRRDTAADDGDLMQKIAAASSAVLTYMKGFPIGMPERDEQGEIVRDSAGEVIYQRDSAGTLIIRPEVKYAVLMLVAEFYKNREAEQAGIIDPKFGYGYLPRPVIALLYPLRDPALA